MRGSVRSAGRKTRLPAPGALVGDALRMDREGASFREIGAMLAARGVDPRRGRSWHASSVRAMLRSRMATERGA